MVVVVTIVQAVDLNLSTAAARVNELAVTDVDRSVSDTAAASRMEEQHVAQTRCNPFRYGKIRPKHTEYLSWREPYE
jgi:hypothetical protein